jgi:hypothetical protein
MFMIPDVGKGGKGLHVLSDENNCSYHEGFKDWVGTAGMSSKEFANHERSGCWTNMTRARTKRI